MRLDMDCLSVRAACRVRVLIRFEWVIIRPELYLTATAVKMLLMKAVMMNR